MSNPNIDKFKALLKASNYSITKPRARLFDILQNNPALSLKQVIALAKSQDQVTVYRNVELFEKLGIISRVRLGWNTKIELSDLFKHHHHHFTCLKCDHVIDLPEDPIIENQIQVLTRSHAFIATDHHLEIRGYCKNCIA